MFDVHQVVGMSVPAPYVMTGVFIHTYSVSKRCWGMLDTLAHDHIEPMIKGCLCSAKFPHASHSRTHCILFYNQHLSLAHMAFGFWIAEVGVGFYI